MEVVEEIWTSGRTCRLRVRSAAVGRDAVVHLILPVAGPPAGRPRPSGGAPTRRPPVLLLLHGADATPGHWESRTAMLDRCADLDAVVVMPEGGGVGFCANWRRPERPARRPLDAVVAPLGTAQAGTGPPAWETFHLEELLPWVRERFGASRRTVVLGISMGGRGAIAYAARHPGRFAAAAAFSGVLDTLGPRIPSLIASALLTHGQHRHAIWGSPIARRTAWEADNPLDLAPALAGTPLYLARGDAQPSPGAPRQPFFAQLERIIGPCTDALATRLEQLGIPATVSISPGVHDWPLWAAELDLAWPFLRAGLGL